MANVKVTNIERLANIEAQTDYIAKSLDTLTAQLAKTEEQRVTNLIEYKIQHEKVVEAAVSAAKKADDAEKAAIRKAEEIEKASTKEITEVKKSFNVLENDVKDRIGETVKMVNELKDKISPLLVAHKILVWVTIFFASSIGLLLWGIFTHTISVMFNNK